MCRLGRAAAEAMGAGDVWESEGAAGRVFYLLQFMRSCSPNPTRRLPRPNRNSSPHLFSPGSPLPHCVLTSWSGSTADTAGWFSSAVTVSSSNETLHSRGHHRSAKRSAKEGPEGDGAEKGDGDCCLSCHAREALDQAVFLRDLAALVDGMLLGPGRRRCRVSHSACRAPHPSKHDGRLQDA